MTGHPLVWHVCLLMTFECMGYRSRLAGYGVCPLFSMHMGSKMSRGVSHATRVTVLWSLLVVLAAVRLVSS